MAEDDMAQGLRSGRVRCGVLRYGGAHAGVLRHAEHAFDGPFGTTGPGSDRPAYDLPERSGDPIAGGGAVLGNSHDTLSRCEEQNLTTAPSSMIFGNADLMIDFPA